MHANATAALVLLAALAACAEQKAPVAEKNSAAIEGYRPPALKPFEDLPPEEAPPRKRRTGDEGAFSKSIGLEDSAVWTAALSRAEQAEEFYVAAQEAHRAGDRATLNEKGRKARSLFDRALEDTAVFEEQNIETYGERDVAVARIVRTRSTWFDRTLWLHKSVSRASK